MVSKLIEIEGSERYLGDRINNIMGKVNGSETLVSRLGGGREGYPLPWSLQRQRMCLERNTGSSVLEMLFVYYPSEDKELTVSFLAWNTAEKPKLGIFANAY